MKAITLPALERMIEHGCQAPDCQCSGKKTDTLFFSPACHVGADVGVRYSKGDDVVVVECMECGDEVCHIKVAKD